MANFCGRSITRHWAHRSARRGLLPPKSRWATGASWYNAWSSVCRSIICSQPSRATPAIGSARAMRFCAHRIIIAPPIFSCSRFPLICALSKLYKKQTDAFHKAAELFERPIEVLKIPYENTTLPGYFIKPDASGAARKTLPWYGRLRRHVRGVIF